MRQISHRRMERWLDRETAKLRRGRRYGLCCMRVEDPSEPGGARFVLGEAVPMKIRIGRMRYLKPLLMSICAVRPGMSWAGARRGRLRRADLSAHANAERARDKARAEEERKVRDLEEDAAKEISYAILRAAGQKIRVGGGW